MWLVLPTSADARIILQQARISASTELDTNPTMSSNGKQSIWRYTASPNYKIVSEDEVSQLFLDAGLRIQRSSDTGISIDREDPVLSAGWTRDFEKGQFSVLSNYTKTSTRITEFDESGTGIVQKDGSSTSKSINLSGSRLLTDRLSMSAGANYRKQDYSGTSLGNYSSKGINLGLSYAYNEKISPFLNYSVSDYRPESKTSARRISTNISLGANILLSPQMSSNFSVGTNHISSSGKNGWTANAGLIYDDLRHHYTGNYSRSVNATGAGGFIESDRLSLNYSYELTAISKLGADYSISKNNSINDAQTQRVSGWYSRQLSPSWDLRLTLQHKELDSSSRSARADIAGISINYQWSEF